MTLDLPVVVLCGGLGTRLRPAIADRPKALAPVGDGTFLALQLELLRDCGARRFVLCVGYMAEHIKAAFGDGSAFGVRIDYSHDGENPLGTGGALKRAEAFFTPAAVVVNGDTYIDVDLTQLVRIHSSARDRGAVATLTLARMPDASRYGAVEVAGNRVIGFREKAGVANEWVNAGMYVIDRALLDYVPADEATSLERAVFPTAIRNGLTLAAFTQEKRFTDIGTPEEFRAFVREREAAHAA